MNQKLHSENNCGKWHSFQWKIWWERKRTLSSLNIRNHAGYKFLRSWCGVSILDALRNKLIQFTSSRGGYEDPSTCAELLCQSRTFGLQELLLIGVSADQSRSAHSHPKCYNEPDPKIMFKCLIQFSFSLKWHKSWG